MARDGGAGLRDRLWRTSFWHQLLYPELGPAGMVDDAGVISSAVRRLFGKDLPHYVVAAAVSAATVPGYAARRRIAARVLGQLRRTLPWSQRRLLGFVHGCSLYFCGYLSTSPAQLQQSLAVVVNQLQQEDIRLTAGVAFHTIGAHDLRSFRRLAQHAVVALRVQLQVEKGHVLVYETPRRGDQDLISVRPLVEKLERVTRWGDVRQIDAMCDEVSRLVFGVDYIPLLKIRGLLQSFVISLSMAAQAAGVDPGLLSMFNQHYFERILMLYDYGELEDVIHAAIIEFIGAVHRVRERESIHPVIRDVEMYVVQNLQEALSLSGVAQAVGLSAPYLSKLFHEQRGMTLTDFINEQRIEKACAMLREDETLTVCTIAFHVGFGSIQHFNRIFKSHVGCTPSQFRILKYVHSHRKECVD